MYAFHSLLSLIYAIVCILKVVKVKIMVVKGTLTNSQARNKERPHAQNHAHTITLSHARCSNYLAENSVEAFGTLALESIDQIIANSAILTDHAFTFVDV